MKKAVIKLIKKINLNTEATFDSSIEIREKAIFTINRSYSLPATHSEITSWDWVKKNNAQLYSKILLNIQTEINYYTSNFKSIPGLMDTLDNLEIPLETCFIDFKNPDIRQTSEHEIFIYFVSKELVLLDSIENKMLLSYFVKEEEQNTVYDSFFIELNKDLSIKSYKKS